MNLQSRRFQTWKKKVHNFMQVCDTGLLSRTALSAGGYCWTAQIQQKSFSGLSMSFRVLSSVVRRFMWLDIFLQGTVTVSKCGAGTITTLLTGEKRICCQLIRDMVTVAIIWPFTTRTVVFPFDRQRDRVPPPPPWLTSLSPPGNGSVSNTWFTISHTIYTVNHIITI
jgi:hypothetical protein